jgi:hypothetical protein
MAKHTQSIKSVQDFYSLKEDKEMMKTQQFYGVTSLGLTFIATIIALVVMFLTSWVLGVIYLAVMMIAPQAILRTYCAKCPCKVHCGHVFPGKAAMAFAKDGPYTPTDFLIMGVSMLLLIGLPQFWLWQYPIMFGAYWVLTGIGLTQILLVICPRCKNVYCPVKAMVNRR